MRSQGGWASVVSMRQRREPEVCDDRILGSGSFVGAILAEVEDKKKDVLRTRAAIPNLSILAQRIADSEAFNPSDLLRPQGNDVYPERDASSARWLSRSSFTAAHGWLVSSE